MIDADTPIAGYYAMKFNRYGVLCAVRIWHGPPLEPWTGEEMDRAPRWNAQVNGKWADIGTVWPMCAGEPISEERARELIGLAKWGEKNGHAAIADPRKPLSPSESPLLF
jgi:hypothetical protein